MKRTAWMVLLLAALPAWSLADGTPVVTPLASHGPVAKKAKKTRKAKPVADAKGATAVASAPKETAAPAKKEHWVCPMHDGGESDHAGKCPKCGMDLVKED